MNVSFASDVSNSFLSLNLDIANDLSGRDKQFVKSVLDYPDFLSASTKNIGLSGSQPKSTFESFFLPQNINK